MLETQFAVKTFRGTLAEVLTHQNEIPPDSVIELRVFPTAETENEPTLAESLAGLLEESANIVRGEPIRYSSPIKQAVSDIVSQKFERQGFSQ